MHIVFVHGWSVTDTGTYGEMPAWLARQTGADVQNVYLGKYISFVDAVTVDDIARAFQQALTDTLGSKVNDGFACITHSTGGPVVRLWMKLYHEKNLSACPMKHLVMLAPANHGSALAQLGKGVFGRLKSMAEGIEPGARVLDFLELGSEGSWKLNESWLDYDCVAAGIYVFVLTGQTIDRNLYDHLNSYTDEAGSDGVVRVCAANMNYGLLQLTQDGEKLVVNSSRRRLRTALGVLPGLAHSGEKIGIMKSVTRSNASTHPAAVWTLRCLAVSSPAEYAAMCDRLDALTVQTQKDERVEEQKKLFGTKKYITNRYTMLVFRFADDRGEILSDYDLYITGGPRYSPDDLPPGFFVDRQRNKHSPGKLTYYLDYDVLRRGLNHQAMEGRIGFRAVARPTEDSRALVFYRPIEFQSDEDSVSDVLHRNETLMVEIRFQRWVDAKVFRVESSLTPGKIDIKPTGKTAG